MIPKTRCSQRSAIISLACGVSRNEKCGSHWGKEITSRKKFMGTPRTSCASNARIRRVDNARPLDSHDWCLVETSKVLQVFGLASVSHDAVVSFLEKPSLERTDRVIIPVLDLFAKRFSGLSNRRPAYPHPSALPLLTERSILYTHLGNRYEQTERPRPRHP